MDAALFRKKVMGCWLGKAVGGTLGQPYEGCDGPNDLTFYDPVPTDMVPNDDLDLQVLWSCVMDAMEKPMVISVLSISIGTRKSSFSGRYSR